MIISKSNKKGLKNTICRVLSVAMLVGAAAFPASAAGESADFVLRVNNSASVQIGLDDTAEVTLTIERDADYDFYSMQDYIKFDTEYFTLDESSVKVKTYVKDGIAVDLMNYAAIKTGGEYDRVFVNRASLTPVSFSASETVITFELTPKTTGTTEITHYRTEMTGENNSQYTVNEENAEVTIVSGTTVTPDPTATPTNEPTAVPTSTPTAAPSDAPTATPTVTPTATATGAPTATPTVTPTATPLRSGSSGSSSGGSYSRATATPTAAPDVTAAPDATAAPDPGSTTQPENKSGFSDVPDDVWYAEAVEYVHDNGIMNGVSDTEFDPLQPITRAMFVTIIHRMEGEPAASTASTFSDVERDTWYTAAVDWAAENNIVYGYSEDEYAPNQIILREQMAAILYRYYGFLGISTDVENSAGYTKYSDSGSISEYAVPAVNWATEIGIMNGDSEGTFRPSDSASRAEAAQVIMNIDKGKQ